MGDEEREIGVHLKRWRLLVGDTRARVAAASGISVGTLARLENGEGSSLSTMLAVCDTLGLGGQIAAALDPADSDLGRARAHLWNRRRASPARSVR